MWSKRPILQVSLRTSTALAPAMAGQSSSTGTEAPSDHKNHPQRFNAWALCKKLSLKQVQANPTANNAQDGLFRRSLCAL
jgi:hypothetical protein